MLTMRKTLRDITLDARTEGCILQAHGQQLHYC